MNRSRLSRIKMMNMVMGTMAVKKRLIGKGNAINKYRVNSKFPKEKIGTIRAQKTPEAPSIREMKGMRRTNL